MLMENIVSVGYGHEMQEQVFSVSYKPIKLFPKFDRVFWLIEILVSIYITEHKVSKL